MHMQLLHNDKVIAFDRTDFGPSNLPLSFGRCRMDPDDTALKVDCTAHSVLYDTATTMFRPLMVHTDTWCSSGSVLPNGTLVQTGGFNDGERRLRMFTPCLDLSCDWVEFPGYLSERRWYATNQILPDGRVIIVGGRKQFSYEFYPKSNANSPSSTNFNFLQETSDPFENNLYPFVHLLPDGNLFIFANTRSVLLDYKQNRVVKEFPQIPGGEPRNYPSTGSSVLLPLDENIGNTIEAEVMVCGGAPRGSFEAASQGNFMEALNTCGRIKVTDPNPTWVMESMPLPRAMGDMLLLPNGYIIIINGVKSGTAGWEHGRDPVLTPVIYHPSETDSGKRFTVMSPASKPRLYHSSAVLLRDGRVLVGGSNPHIFYNFTGVDYPTDLSLEAFSPPYLSLALDPVRPTIRFLTNDVLGYRVYSYITFTVPSFTSASEVSVRLLAPSFTTHSYAMNQRMVVLKLIKVTQVNIGTYYATVVGPSTQEIAPAGYYLLFVVHAGVPSTGSWVQVM
ncbi:aldehyde oxidase GLOX [Lotus japonicus]|uniref:aldehyde oxidase GLOX n=1 Tax=Lotus japonicus TaxID=34305 RepID=UPI00258D0363|nr:aldehyde oxidase GLOX [Lotus japonicus]